MIHALAAIPAQARSIADATDDWPTLAHTLDTLFLRAGFNTTIVVVGTTLLGLAAGLVGAFALLRKRSLMADALSHATLPGLCLAFLIADALGLHAKSMGVLLLGAAASGVAGVLLIQLLVRHPRLKEDAAIGAGLSVTFGVGVVLLSLVPQLTTTPAAGLSRFIYGQTAAMIPSDAILMAAVACTVIAACLLLGKELALVCFNDAFARVTGYKVTLIDVALLTLIVLVTVAGIQAVGMILVVSMFIIPAAAARFWTDRLWPMVMLSGTIGAISGWLGSTASALLPRKPAGSVIVLVCGTIFLISMLTAPRRGVIAGGLRRLRMRLRIAGEHLLESLYDLDQSDTPIDARAIREINNQRGWNPLRATIAWSIVRARGYVTRATRPRATDLLPSKSVPPSSSTSPHPRWQLTEEGRRIGARTARNHALWAQYLTSYADIAPSHVDWSVDQVEHVLSEPLIKELEAALRRSPGGTP